MKPGKSDSTESVSYISLLKIPGIIVIALLLMFTLNTPLMVDPILSIHLQSYGLSVSVIGLAFLTRALVTVLLSPIVGKIYAGITCKLPVVICGLFGMGISFLFLGPSELIGMKQYEEVWPIYVSIGTLSLSFTFALVPAYERFTAYATYGCPEAKPEALMTTMGSLFFMLMTLGDFIAPSLAGSLSDAVGFSWTMTISATMCLSGGTLLLVIYLIFRDNAISWDIFDGKDAEEFKEKEALLGKK